MSKQPRKNTILRAKLVQKLVRKNYEPGRQDRGKSWVYKYVVYKQMPISERTFFRYLKMDVSGEREEKEDKNQLKLFE
jgi:hypothetical protein